MAPSAQFPARYQAHRALADYRCTVIASAEAKSSSLRTATAPASAATVAREVLAPREHLHAERPADRRHPPPDVPPAPRRPASGRASPSRSCAASRRRASAGPPRHVPDEGEGSCAAGPVRGGRRRCRRCRTIHDARPRPAGPPRRNRRVAHEQPQVGGERRGLGGERRPLAHRDNHVEQPRLGRQVRGVGDVPVKRHDVGRAERRPVSALQGDSLMISRTMRRAPL